MAKGISIQEIKIAAEGIWPDIHANVTGIPDRYLTSNHGPCPRQECGGDDRFRMFEDWRSTGGAICNQCNRAMSDGIAVCSWFLGINTAEAIKRIANYIGLDRSQQTAKSNLSPRKDKSKEDRDPEKHLVFRELSLDTANFWAARKPPIDAKALFLVDAKQATYRTKYPVIALPIRGDAAAVVGWCLYHSTGKTLPAWTGKDTSEPEQVKVKVTGGSSAGWIGPLVPAGTKIKLTWKVEGPSDMLALLSLGLPEGHTVCTNAFGAGENPANNPWMLERFRDSICYVIHDCDVPGQQGATIAKNGDRVRPGWAPAIANVASEVRNVVLPYVIEPGHGKDLRDWIVEQKSLGLSNTDIYQKLLDMAEQSSIVPALEIATRKENTPKPIEGSDYDSTLITSTAGQSDSANARRFVSAYHLKLRYIPEWERWLTWDGARWHDDSGVGVYQCAREYAESLWSIFATDQIKDMIDKDIVKLAKFVKSTNDAKRIQYIENLARNDARVVTSHAMLNSDPYLFNCLNGTIDLRSGKLLPHSQEHLITLVAPVQFDANAKPTQFLETLDLVFDGKKEMINYVKQLLGYSMAGLTTEHILPMCYGGGNNGKSTIWNTVLKVFGDYGTLANQELLLASKSQHPTEKAALYQRRLVAISEPSEGRSLDEARVKELTGDDMITARRMREDFWTFKATHTFWMATNHKPRILGTDEGIWRRVKLIPFEVDISKRTKAKKGFSDHLFATEASGILNWLIEGFQSWKAHGFIEPEGVTQATKSYRNDENVIEQFLAEQITETGDQYDMIVAGEFYDAFRRYSGSKMTQTSFGKLMKERYESARPTSGSFRGKTVYLGLQFVTQATEPEETEPEESCA